MKGAKPQPVSTVSLQLRKADTKRGKYMTESQALAGGYRESREHQAEKPLVWVNPATHVFHRQGDQWYGKTAGGEYMTEEDALRAGYREAKP